MKNTILMLSHLSIGIKKDKTTFNAVRDVGLTVKKGEIVGIVGESGCGKSLTALSIPGLLSKNISITGGNIIFDGRDITKLPVKEKYALRGKDISFVFQEPMTSLDPLMKIGRQIAEPLKLHGWRDKTLINERVRDVVGLVGLADAERIINSYPHQLSGGQRQRVMIAIAIANKPKLLICDEPTTALDVSIQAQILDLLKHINKTLGTSILFISHDLGVICRICDRVLVMYAGRIVESGTVRNIFIHPVHEYTKGLISSIPQKEHKGKALKSIPGKVPSIEETVSGCPFAPRCSVSCEECYVSFPEALGLSENHYVSCHLADPESEMEYVRI